MTSDAAGNSSTSSYVRPSIATLLGSSPPVCTCPAELLMRSGPSMDLDSPRATAVAAASKRITKAGYRIEGACTERNSWHLFPALHTMVSAHSKVRTIPPTLRVRVTSGADPPDLRTVVLCVINCPPVCRQIPSPATQLTPPRLS